MGCIHSFENVGSEPVRWIETQAPLPPCEGNIPVRAGLGAIRIDRLNFGLRSSNKTESKESVDVADRKHPGSCRSGKHRGAASQPYTSQEFMESLRDGREIWIYGERVKDVTTHPAFRNTVRMLARLYDALHDSQEEPDPVLPDRDRQRQLHAQVLQGLAQRRGDGRRARRHRRMGARDLRLDGPQPGLQGGVSWPRWAPMPISIIPSMRTRSAGTRRCRRKSPSSTTRS